MFRPIDVVSPTSFSKTDIQQQTQIQRQRLHCAKTMNISVIFFLLYSFDWVSCLWMKSTLTNTVVEQHCCDPSSLSHSVSPQSVPPNRPMMKSHPPLQSLRMVTHYKKIVPPIWVLRDVHLTHSPFSLILRMDLCSASQPILARLIFYTKMIFYISQIFLRKTVFDLFLGV